MADIIRLSPIRFDQVAAETEERDGFTVVLKYKTEPKGTALIDLSHRPRWDLQDKEVDRFRTKTLTIPEKPGQTAIKYGLVVNRLNRTQCSLWGFGSGEPSLPGQPSVTVTTDAQAMLALIGPEALAIMEKLCPLDLTPSGAEPPYLIQGPVVRVPAQIVVLPGGEGEAGIILGFSRGYGSEMVEVILEAGAEFGLAPAGEARFMDWFAPEEMPEPEPEAEEEASTEDAGGEDEEEEEEEEVKDEE